MPALLRLQWLKIVILHIRLLFIILLIIIHIVCSNLKKIALKRSIQLITI